VSTFLTGSYCNVNCVQTLKVELEQKPVSDSDCGFGYLAKEGAGEVRGSLLGGGWFFWCWGFIGDDFVEPVF
jgi:hypothetical protein